MLEDDATPMSSRCLASCAWLALATVCVASTNKLSSVNATIVIIGYGSGVSAAVARRFGREGYSVAIASRTAAKVEAAALALRAEGITAHGFVVDAANASSVSRLITHEVPAKLSMVMIVHHNVNYWPSGNRITDASAEALQAMHAICVGGVIAAVSASLPQLSTWVSGSASVLVTNGGAGLASKAATYSMSAPGGFLCNAEKMQAARILAPQLEASGIHLGEVVIAALVSRSRSTPHSVHPDDVADAFLRLHTHRDERSLVLSPGPFLESTDVKDCPQQPRTAALLAASPHAHTADGGGTLHQAAALAGACAFFVFVTLLIHQPAPLRLRCL